MKERNGLSITGVLELLGRFKYQLINMEGWKNLPAYNCTLADGVSDYGRLLELFVKTARYSRNLVWAQR